MPLMKRTGKTAMRQRLAIMLLAAACTAIAADRPPSAGDNPAQDALVKCLQETATHFAEKCTGAACETRQLSNTIALAQRTHCGYDTTQGPAPRAIPPEPLLKCLRQTADDTTIACQKGGCFPNSVFFIIGASQKSRCGYTAFEPTELPPAMRRDTKLANCLTSQNSKGEWVAACTGSN
jgi:hypothetical protein